MRWRKLVAGALVLVGGAACSASEILQSIGQFPCANDGTCPDGFSCTGGSCQQNFGVNELPVDSVCTGADACSGYASCLYGVCGAPEMTVGGCPTGRNIFVGECLLDCSAASCPMQLKCAYAYGGKSGQSLLQACVSPDQAAVNGASCSDTVPCKQYGSFAIYACAGGTCALDCTGNKPCPGNQTCQTPDGGYQQGCF